MRDIELKFLRLVKKRFEVLHGCYFICVVQKFRYQKRGKFSSISLVIPSPVNILLKHVKKKV